MPKIVDKKKKAEAISDAALKVFRERGYNKARMADIARMAGMGKGTLYEYFNIAAYEGKDKTI
jgi:TetR/AcrR family fatty acid metabolism transcriptional regulator